jgi:ribosomal protein S18 acetylase RimI-like enzyme
MDVLIRPAITADIPQMCDLLSDLFSIESDFSPDSQKQASGLGLLLDNRNGSSAILVAERNEEVIGMCTVQAVISTAQGGPVGLIEDLVVKREHRGNGIGTRLLSEIVRWCALKNITRLQLLRDADNKSAFEFYTRNGWSSTRLVCMRKML